MARFVKIANHPLPVGTIIFLLTPESMKGWRAQIIGVDMEPIAIKPDGKPPERYALRLLDHPVPGHKKERSASYLITRSWKEVSLQWPLKIEPT